MSRLLLLVILGLWLIEAQGSPRVGSGVGVATYLGGYVLLVTAMAVWARVLALRLWLNPHHGLAAFHRGTVVARTLIPAWMAVAMFAGLGWVDTVHGWLGPLDASHMRGPEQRFELILPGLLVGAMPALLAWMALWWAQYPVDRAAREMSLLQELDDGLPVHGPPDFRGYFWANFRLQLLFTLIPVLLILLFHDLVLGVLRLAWPTAPSGWLMLPAAGAVYLAAPQILRRVLDTEPLPQSPLRERLESICRLAGLKHRDILLWRTHYSVGNAAVMGVLPRMRYILLSDLLLESMDDQQIEAVFAHELGHVVHRHMLWYLVFFLILLLAAAGPGTAMEYWLHSMNFSPDQIAAISSLGMLAGVLALFGYISRNFERQADVFAARMIQSDWGTVPATSPPLAGANGSYVGQFGAAVFNSALRRVATVNNLPIKARSWCHGSIAKRMQYLQDLSADPALTRAFDKGMGRLYAAMVLAVVALGSWAVPTIIREVRLASRSGEISMLPSAAYCAGAAATSETSSTCTGISGGSRCSSLRWKLPLIR